MLILFLIFIQKNTTNKSEDIKKFIMIIMTIIFTFVFSFSYFFSVFFFFFRGCRVFFVEDLRRRW